MPKRTRMVVDQRRSSLMIELIDKMLGERETIRNLERLVENNTKRPTMFAITWSYKVVRIRSNIENKGKVSAEMELVLEQTQQDTSHEVSADTGSIHMLSATPKLLSGIEDNHHGPSDAMHNPSHPLKVSQQNIVSFLIEITRISIDFLTPS
ncbi:hypothetical protein Tco_0156204 [Tanacetum coccineum]